MGRTVPSRLLSYEEYCKDEAAAWKSLDKIRARGTNLDRLTVLAMTLFGVALAIITYKVCEKIFQ